MQVKKQRIMCDSSAENVLKIQWITCDLSAEIQQVCNLSAENITENTTNNVVI